MARLPEIWFSAVEVLVDRDEILVVGRLTAPEGESNEEAIAGFRETSRDARVRLAAEAEARFVRKVSWAAQCGDSRVLFTHLSVPVMTRLRLTERATLDTLVVAGVARSRSDALGWCVRLVSEHEGQKGSGSPSSDEPEVAARGRELGPDQVGG